MKSIVKHCYFQAELDEVSSRFSVLKKLNRGTVRRVQKFLWTNDGIGSPEWHAMVAFFGKSGYGKSSTINSIIGQDILKTSDVAACTQRCDSVDLRIAEDNFISFSDFPGIGEGEYKDREYLDMYRRFLRSVSVVVYTLRADMRDHSIDEMAFDQVLPTWEDQKKVIFAINGCDKIEPLSRAQSDVPTDAQLESIQKKIADINRIFRPHNPVIAYSAHTGWGMDNLMSSIVDLVLANGDITIQE